MSQPVDKPTIKVGGLIKLDIWFQTLEMNKIIEISKPITISSEDSALLDACNRYR